MKIIAITTPTVTNNDIYLIKGLVDNGIDTIHLRKPNATIDECRRLLSGLNAEQRAKIIVHNFAELYFEFSLKGIHINKNACSFPKGYNGFKSRSCHSLAEIVRYKKDYDYLFLSPIFDSISKNGYKSAFSHKELQQASSYGIIDEKVIALGGVTFNDIPYLKALNFGGVAMIGNLYNTQGLEKLKDIK